LTDFRLRFNLRAASAAGNLLTNAMSEGFHARRFGRGLKAGIFKATRWL
jgi:hypothetical protein